MISRRSTAERVKKKKMCELKSKSNWKKKELSSEKVLVLLLIRGLFTRRNNQLGCRFYDKPGKSLNYFMFEER